MRKCKKCNIEKPFAEFHISGGYLKSTCKDCANAYTRAHYNPEREKGYRKKYQADGRRQKTRRRHELKTRYGLTPEDYQALLDRQGGGCAICGKTDGTNGTQKHLPVDHHHGTGAVRGILCKNCNQGIGLFKEDPSRLRKAADYLS